MNLYPALKAEMGTWTYYIVKMQMKDIVKEVGFASEIYNNKTLDDAIQRTLNESRVKKEIVQYLAKRSDRFFSSIVVAALGGNPTYTPVEITDDPKFSLLKPAGFGDAFGVLTFDGGQRYFALDGQHRLKAIKTLIEQAEDDVPELPESFLNEEVSVIMLVREEARDDEFMTSYRRIFSSLNRYAKPTDRDTNIIMDEDDAIAILTRRLLTEHEFFIWQGRPDTNAVLKTQGKNLRSGDSYFTTLQTLYSMNEKLLKTPERSNYEFASRAYKLFRPPEEHLDSLYNELVVYWNAMLAEITTLRNDPMTMREHDADIDNPDGLTDNLLFWPIGQELLADVVRILLNRRLPDPECPGESDVRSCIQVLSKVPWDLRRSPWAGLLLIEEPDSGKRHMRNEDRKRALQIAERILLFQVGVAEPAPDALEDLKTEWHAMLIPRPNRDEVDALWQAIATPLV